MLPYSVKRPLPPHLVRAHRRRGRLGLALAGSLSLLAGMTDAIGFMALGDFVSFMSGNTTRLAVAVGAHDLTTILRLGLAVLAFVLGNALGVLCSRIGGRPTLSVLLAVTALLCMAGLLPPDLPVAALLCAVLAMGMLNAAVEQVNGVAVGLTYITGALSRFGRGLGRWLAGDRRLGWRVQLVPWAGMLLGAVAGAFLQNAMGLHALLGAAVLAALLAALSCWIPARWQLHYLAKG